jgi:hypothetical protein
MARPKGSKTNPNRVRFPTKSEIHRFIKALEEKGLPSLSVRINPNTGELTVVTSPIGEAVNVDFSKANPWDKLLRKKDAED